MKKDKLFYILTLLPFLGCTDTNIGLEAPKCLESRIETFNQSSHCDDSSVQEFMFQGKKVYVFDPGTCGNDMQSAVYDANCNSLGALGGIAGETSINGVDFPSNSEYIRTVWEN